MTSRSWWAGYAVEFYTQGAYKSLDLDVIARKKEQQEGTGIMSVEDLIVDRLNACKHWRSQLDCEQAEYLLKAYYPVLDKTCLEKRAREDGGTKEIKHPDLFH